jgi:hypothetical protein
MSGNRVKKSFHNSESPKIATFVFCGTGDLEPVSRFSKRPKSKMGVEGGSEMQLCTLGISTEPYRECRNIASKHVNYPVLLADDPNDPGSEICQMHWTICRERGIIDNEGNWQ